YIMIDEYQDTNPIQFQLAESLAKKHNNLFVVGDDDQSIYGWRGADIQNILEFKADLIVKLQENYRSSQNILDAANNVIANNSKRHSKTLFSRNKTNLPITLFHAPDEQAEAKSVVERILQLKKEGYNFKDIAILYRSNILSRNFEIELMQASWKRNDTWVRGIPYVIFGGLEFAERSEIKDLFAYLKLISNEKDEEALLRIINVPRRGISDKTLAVLTEYNRAKGISFWKVLQEISEDILELPITAKAKASITEFMQTIHSAKEKFTNESLKGALTWFIEKIEMKRAVEEDVKSEKMRKFKLDNLTEVINSVEFYEEESKDPSLEDFISSSILARQNTYNKASHKHDAVQLMTFHSSKGLEFPVCFLCGLEDHILPHEKSLMQTGLEEERRLFYVAITRCRERLFMTMARKRKKMGKPIVTNPSRFLFEVPKNLLTLTSHKTFDK
ncbi:MAG: 3'-5' exonuclease, partial [Chlamydiota bacterium]